MPTCPAHSKCSRSGVSEGTKVGLLKRHICLKSTNLSLLPRPSESLLSVVALPARMLRRLPALEQRLDVVTTSIITNGHGHDCWAVNGSRMTEGNLTLRLKFEPRNINTRAPEGISDHTQILYYGARGSRSGTDHHQRLQSDWSQLQKKQPYSCQALFKPIGSVERPRR